MDNQFAHINDEALQIINKAESMIKAKTGKDVALIAYSMKEG